MEKEDINQICDLCRDWNLGDCRKCKFKKGELMECKLIKKEQAAKAIRKEQGK